MNTTNRQQRNTKNDPTSHENDPASHEYDSDERDTSSINDNRSHEYPFPHHRLDAYRIAIQMAATTQQLTSRIPRGYRYLADQLNRASASVVLNLAEGANKLGAGEKRQCFSRARGECGEVAAAAELVAVFAVVPQSHCNRVIRLAARVGAMLTGLIKRLDR